MSKRIFLCCLLFCSYYISAQSCFNEELNVIGVRTINKPLLFVRDVQCVKEDDYDIYVKKEVLMTDSLYFDSISKTDIDMDSALFDSNCYVMDYMIPVMFLTNYLIEHISDSIYLDLLTQTYTSRIVQTYRLHFFEEIMIEAFYTMRFSPNTFLIVEIQLGLYNSLWEKYCSPPHYRYSRNLEDNRRTIKLAIPIKMNH